MRFDIALYPGVAFQGRKHSDSNIRQRTVKTAGVWIVSNRYSDYPAIAPTQQEANIAPAG